MSKIKSFRGKIASTGIETINLHTNNGKTGYRIVKFELFPATPDSAYESVVQIFSTIQSTASITVDFANQELLGAAWYAFQGSGSSDATGYMKQVFDNLVFNQDIHITCKDGQGGDINYYIELEQMELDLSEQTAATLKDIRNNRT
jgi:hypothetical protein